MKTLILLISIVGANYTWAYTNFECSGTASVTSKPKIFAHKGPAHTNPKDTTGKLKVKITEINCGDIQPGVLAQVEPPVAGLDYKVFVKTLEGVTLEKG